MFGVPDQAIALVKRFEGLGDGNTDEPGLQPYLDPIAIWTIGWGSIHDLDGRRVTRETPTIFIPQAEQLLARDSHHALEGVLRLSRPRNLSDAQLSALTSFAFNEGLGAYECSTLRRRVRAGRDKDAAREFGRWVFAGGRRLSGLVRRRAAEAHLYLQGDLP